jgi:hypothetical protein
MTAETYVDARLLPVADELTKIPDIPDADSAKTGHAVAPAQRKLGGSRPETAASGTNEAETTEAAGAVIAVAKASKAAVNGPKGMKRHDPAPLGTGSSSQAGEGGRTLDIHVGNVTLYH